MKAALSSRAVARPEPRRALTDDVLVTLRRDIVAGTIETGARLPEARLAAQLGVSRVPVREAMMTLEREGLLVFDERGAARVRELTPEDFSEIYTMRLALEPMAARLACRRGETADLVALEANLRQTSRARRLAEVTRLDVEFHELLVRASKHSRLLASWTALRSQLETWLARLHRRFEEARGQTREITVRSHSDLLEALRERNEEAAAQFVWRHIYDWRAALPEEFRGVEVL